MIEPGEIQRHKTAIRRQGLSVPIQCLMRDGLCRDGATLFDYGCGHGQDLALLAQLGISCSGWDPVHRPEGGRNVASIVNLGYVINVIEDPTERAHVLRNAWHLCQDVLVVAAISPTHMGSLGATSTYGDGVVTTRSTFQKYYTHQQLRAYIEEVLDREAVPAAPNVFYVFRDEVLREVLLSRKYRRQVQVPRLRVSVALYEANKELLEPLMHAVAELGRLPVESELDNYEGLVARFGSLKRAFAIVRAATGAQVWTEASRRRGEDLLVYLALARFGRRQRLGMLPPTLQQDVKAFFGSYQRACEAADALLFSVGKAEAIDAACQQAPVGKLVDNALIVRKEALGALPPILRVYEGCARVLLGEMDEANLVKLHRHSGKVTYLAYRDADKAENATLATRIKVNLRTLAIDVFDHTSWDAAPNLDYAKHELEAPRSNDHATPRAT